MKLTQEEKSLLDSVERGEWKRIPDFQREAARYREAARATLRKDKRVNIRMAERDLVRFQKTAVHEGLPYQTLHLQRPAQVHQRPAGREAREGRRRAAEQHLASLSPSAEIIESSWLRAWFFKAVRLAFPRQRPGRHAAALLDDAQPLPRADPQLLRAGAFIRDFRHDGAQAQAVPARQRRAARPIGWRRTSACSRCATSTLPGATSSRCSVSGSVARFEAAVVQNPLDGLVESINERRGLLEPFGDFFRLDLHEVAVIAFFRRSRTYARTSAPVPPVLCRP